MLRAGAKRRGKNYRQVSAEQPDLAGSALATITRTASNEFQATFDVPVVFPSSPSPADLAGWSVAGSASGPQTISAVAFGQVSGVQTLTVQFTPGLTGVEDLQVTVGDYAKPQTEQGGYVRAGTITGAGTPADVTPVFSEVGGGLAQVFALVGITCYNNGVPTWTFSTGGGPVTCNGVAWQTPTPATGPQITTTGVVSAGDTVVIPAQDPCFRTVEGGYLVAGTYTVQP